MSLKLVSLNIEGHRHLEERVLPFLQHEKPDVISLQEVFVQDLPLLEKTLGMKAEFVPMCSVDTPSPHMTHALGLWGVAQLSALPVHDWQHAYYARRPEPMPVFMQNQNPNSMHRALLWGTFQKDAESYTLATTHFTWSPKGESTDLQRDHFTQLLALLQTLPPFVLSGDLNAPRGRAIFALFAEHYLDWIPSEIMTSLDPHLHKGGALQLMVDGLFSTPEYRADHVRMVSNVSDHQAIVANLSRVV